MPRLTTEQRAVIVHLHGQGKSNKKIAAEVGCSMKGVAGTIQRWKETGNTTESAGRGRKRASSQRDDRVLVRLSLADRSLNSTELAREWKESAGVTLSSSTVRKRLIANGLRACKARKKPLLTEIQRKRRLEWARQHRSWTVEQWQRVLFSDESTFTINCHTGNSYVRRRPGEEYKPCCLKPTLKHPTSVMIWGCMSGDGVGRLTVVDGMMNGRKYTEVLERVMLPSKRDRGWQDGTWSFQDDNAPCHRSRLVKDWMADHQVNNLPWPAQSPDLNPIENLWNLVGREVARDKPKTKRELIEKLIHAWYHVIKPETVAELVKSMPRRCQAVIKSKGWPTKY